MTHFHQVVITAFVYELEDPEQIKEGLRSFIPVNFEEEKLSIERQKARGFFDRPIHILSLTLKKKNHIAIVIDKLREVMSEPDKALLRSQAESRMDPDFHFFLRLDKDKWIIERVAELVEHGKCIHFNITLACFPRKKETALAIINEVFQ